MISITNVITNSWIFLALFAVALGFSVRKIEKKEFFPASTTTELKGLAIFVVIFIHVGYFLVNDNRFLFPLSILGGVGVNLFLFLSGYGLTVSTLKKPLSRLHFYLKRLLKLYIPLWIVLGVLFLFDWIILDRTYDVWYIARSFAGFFPHADLWKDINSPLWYFSLILFYYLLFPLVFSKRAPWLSAFILYGISFILLKQQFSILENVSGLYRVHLLAFPLGMIFAWSLTQSWWGSAIKKITQRVQGLISKKIPDIHLYYGMVAFLLVLVIYTAYHSGVGGPPRIEELISLVTMAAIIILFLIKRFEFQFLSVFGLYSYEIYLFHWPLMARYDVLFRTLPASVAMIAYLGLFLLLGWSLKNVSNFSRKET